MASRGARGERVCRRRCGIALFGGAVSQGGETGSKNAGEAGAAPGEVGEKFGEGMETGGEVGEAGGESLHQCEDEDGE